MKIQELIRNKGRSKRLYSQARLPEEQHSVQLYKPEEHIPQAEPLPIIQQKVLKRTHKEKPNEEEKFITLIKPVYPEEAPVPEIKEPEKDDTHFFIDEYIEFNYDLTHSALMNLLDLLRLKNSHSHSKLSFKCSFTC